MSEIKQKQKFSLNTVLQRIYTHICRCSPFCLQFRWYFIETAEFNHVFNN